MARSVNALSMREALPLALPRIFEQKNVPWYSLPTVQPGKAMTVKKMEPPGYALAVLVLAPDKGCQKGALPPPRCPLATHPCKVQFERGSGRRAALYVPFCSAEVKNFVEVSYSIDKSKIERGVLTWQTTFKSSKMI